MLISYENSTECVIKHRHRHRQVNLQTCQWEIKIKFTGKTYDERILAEEIQQLTVDFHLSVVTFLGCFCRFCYAVFLDLVMMALLAPSLRWS